MTERILAATGQGGLEDTVSPVCGRAPTFTVVEVEGMAIKGAQVIPNPYKDAGSGAGVQAAQAMLAHAPRAVLAGNFGPNVAGVLSAAGVDMVSVAGVTVRQAVQDYLAGGLPPMTASPGPARGMGQGLGRGMGRGGGMGQGMGRGLGRGRGMFAPASGSPPLTRTQGQGGDPTALRRKIAELEAQLAQIRRQLSDVEGGNPDA